VDHQSLLTVVRLIMFAVFAYRVSQRFRSRQARKGRAQQAAQGGPRQQQAPRTRTVGRDTPPPLTLVEGDEVLLRAEASSVETAPERLAVLATDMRLAAVVAANPSCPSAVLEALSGSWNTEALAAIVAHPNALPRTLLALGHLSPAAFFANPVSTLMLLDKPDLPLQCQPDLLLPLVRHADASPGFLSILANHAAVEVADEARMHVNLGGEIAPERLDDELERALWRWQAPWIDERGALVRAAEMRLIAPWIVAPLALYGPDALRRAIALNTDRRCPTLALLRRAGARDDLVGYAAPDPTLPSEVLDLLARTAPWGRRLAARHPAATPATLLRLAGDRAPEVRRLVARHPELPTTALASLAGDPHVAVRKEVGYSERTPRHALERLARDGARAVRVAVAMNRSSAQEVVVTLASDGAWQVRRAAAHHPATGVETLQALARDPHPLVRVEVIKRGDVASERLAGLIGDPHPAVRGAAARHAARAGQAPDKGAQTAWPAGVVRADEGGAPVSAPRPTARLGAIPVPRAAGGRRAPRADRRAGRGAQRTAPLAPAEVAEALNGLVALGRWNKAARAVALAHPDIPAMRRDLQGRTGSWIERCAVARNPEAGEAMLALLARDSNRVVRGVARAARALRTETEGECA